MTVTVYFEKFVYSAMHYITVSTKDKYLCSIQSSICTLINITPRNILLHVMKTCTSCLIKLL
jgi:hypothetical protein